MTCRTCTHATTKSPTGGLSAHRRAMWRLGFVGCRLDRSEATTYSTEYVCDKWSAASAEQMEKRK